jgi:transcriptional regulator GlxA family with amidase domain
MLATTRLPLESIARECGFANANHFGKVFRHQSTDAYRRSVGVTRPRRARAIPE